VHVKSVDVWKKVSIVRDSISSERGSATVEAALITPIILFVLFSFIYVSFYLFDKGRIESELICKGIDGQVQTKEMQNTKSILEKNYKEFITKNLKEINAKGCISKNQNQISYNSRLEKEEFNIRTEIYRPGSGILMYTSGTFRDIYVGIKINRYQATDVVRMYSAFS